ncbi:MAG: hypothetical protein N2544_02260 [Burkholderiales bacterium]|nr:hypothetical protein [Burkholderiales bacterium]
MKLEQGTGKQLLGPIAIALGLAAAGAAALYFSQQWLARTAAAEKALRAERVAMQEKFARATEEEREIREKLAAYNQLVERGIVGEEQRLDWVDAIAQIKTERKLFEVKYSIEPQRALDLPGVKGTPDVEFRASRMRLELPLLHEGDLFVFLGDLSRALRSHVLVRSCSIQRIDRAAVDRGLSPRLRADCSLDLVTIRDQRRTEAAARNKP